MFKPEDKTAEKRTVFNTSSWENKKNYNQAASNTDLSLEDLLDPDLDYDMSWKDDNFKTEKPNFNKDDNSVFNPNSNLGGSIFGQNPYDYYLENELKKNQKKQEKEDNDLSQFYMVLGFVAVGYLGYRLL